MADFAPSRPTFADKLDRSQREVLRPVAAGSQHQLLFAMSTGRLDISRW